MAQLEKYVDLAKLTLGRKQPSWQSLNSGSGAGRSSLSRAVEIRAQQAEPQDRASGSDWVPMDPPQEGVPEDLSHPLDGAVVSRLTAELEEGAIWLCHGTRDD